jgi:hypothetical protein
VKEMSYMHNVRKKAIKAEKREGIRIGKATYEIVDNTWKLVKAKLFYKKG